MKALIMFHHGIGDVIMLTPHLRYLYNKGYKVDLMCRKEVRTSHLLDECPYIGELITIPNPWDAPDYTQALRVCFSMFEQRCGMYDWLGCATHMSPAGDKHKIDMTSFEMGIEDMEDRIPEIFIPETLKKIVKEFIDEFYPNGFIHIHTQIEHHSEHNWDATEWIKENLPEMPIINTGHNEKDYMMSDYIAHTFEIIKNATHRVYSSSVMVHAADALNVPIDIINYGKKDRKVWPIQCEVKHIREEGEMIR